MNLFGRKKNSAQSSDKIGEDVAPASATGDQIGTYPRDVDDIKNQHRRFYRNLRVEHIIMGGLLVTNIVQANVINQLFPLYRVVPFFLTFSDKAEQVVQIHPPSGDLRSLDILNESNVREYVKLRNTISKEDALNLNRWGGKIQAMSSEEVYGEFLNEIKPIYEAAKNGRFTRSVVIDAVAEIQDGYYRVDFTAYDRTIGIGLTDTQERTGSYTVELRFRNLKSKVTYNDRFLNALGFNVVSYVAVPRRAPNPS